MKTETTKSGAHTPEPWTHKGGFVFEASAIPPHGPKYGLIGVAAVQYNEDANAARIVACVNACAGMADPAAELAALRAGQSACAMHGATYHELNEANAKLAAENAALRACREALAAYVDADWPNRYDDGDTIARRADAKSALAAVREGVAKNGGGRPLGDGTVFPVPPCEVIHRTSSNWRTGGAK